MMGDIHTTQSREEIIDWAEQREAYAARVVGVREDAVSDISAEVGALRLGFLGYAPEEALEPMLWDDWFAIFEEHDLTFAYRHTNPDGSFSHDYEIG